MHALGNLAPSSLADWVAGLATTAAVIIALGQVAIVAARQRRNSVRGQADDVTAWFETVAAAEVSLDATPTEGTGSYAYIVNRSGSVIWEVMVAIRSGSRESKDDEPVRHFRRILLSIPPGTHRVLMQEGWHGMHFVPSVDIYFRDSGGRYWYRNNFGQLKRQRRGAIERFKISTPISYDNYERVSS